MVYIPNINSSTSMNLTESNDELICPVKNYMLNSTTINPDPVAAFAVIYPIKKQYEKWEKEETSIAIVPFSLFLWYSKKKHYSSTIVSDINGHRSYKEWFCHHFTGAIFWAKFQPVYLYSEWDQSQFY